MATAKKRKLSGSADGKAIKITQTGTAGDTIHTAVSGTTPGTYDEIWLWAYNSGLSAVVLTIEFGGNANPDDTIKYALPIAEGLVPVVPGLLLQNSRIVRAFATVPNVVTLVGFVNSITD